MATSRGFTIDRLSELLTENDAEYAASLCARRAPCVDSMISIGSDLRELLLPGTRRSHVARSQDPLLRCASLLRHLRGRLLTEIERALSIDDSGRLKLHTNGSCGNDVGTRPGAEDIVDEFLAALPSIRRILQSDLKAAFDGDPAAQTIDEIVLCYPGIEAIWVHRVAHQLLQLGVPLLPRILSEWAHRETGIDIHPGATIGPHFFIDHGTGVVIGETCEIGAHVTLYQGVTLGAWSFPRDDDGKLIRGTKRHPTLEDGVTVYSNTTVLGGDTIIGAGSQIGSCVTLSRSVPANTVVTIEPPSLRFREAG